MTEQECHSSLGTSSVGLHHPQLISGEWSFGPRSLDRSTNYLPRIQSRSELRSAECLLLPCRAPPVTMQSGAAQVPALLLEGGENDIRRWWLWELPVLVVWPPRIPLQGMAYQCFSFTAQGRHTNGGLILSERPTCQFTDEALSEVNYKP